jgi:hypothetical protein
MQASSRASIIRAATPTDIPALAALWYEKMVIQSQMDRRFALMPDAQSRWSEAVRLWLADSTYRVLAAEAEARVVGYAVGRIESAPPGLLPEQLGVIQELALDAHSYQANAGRLLLASLKQWFAARQIAQIIVHAPHRYAVEQAFWRGLGATEWMDTLWMKL